MQAGGDMEKLKTRLRAGSRTAVKRLASLTGVDEELRTLRGRVERLEREVQESRRLHQRLAELTDVVTEILVPAADRQDDRIRELLEKYNKTSY
jgi:TolA-binding protein